MPIRPPRPHAGLRRGLLAAAAVVALAATLSPVTAEPAGAASEQPWSVSVAPSTNLNDGQTVTLTIRTTADYPIYAAEAHVCRTGVTYAPSSDSRPAADFAVGGDNCPLNPISSSAEVAAVNSNLITATTSPEGGLMSLRIGIGEVRWPDENKGPFGLACNASNPCELVVELLGGPGAPTWTPWTTTLSYHLDDPIAGCGGAADGIISSGGSDRLADAWVNWTLGDCAEHATHAKSRGVFAGEGAALAQYSAGSLDVAYTGAGFDPDVGLVDATTTPRASVPVPVALDAAVLAVGNGRPGTNGRKVPYTDIELTATEVATLLSGGPYAMDALLPAIYARNPELLQTGFWNAQSPFQVGASAGAEATSWFATHYLDVVAPDAWKVPDLPLFHDDAGRLRGASASLATADPPFDKSLTLLTGRPALQRNLIGMGGFDFGGVWVLTDLATARALGLTPVSIETSPGHFVAPTPETLAAAVPTLHRDADGLLLPTSAASTSSSRSSSAAADAYPLTFVEYALAPAEPLVNADCSARTSSQAVLADWLGYVTTDGQAQLSDGLEPLTPELRAEATAAIARIGASPSTRSDCPTAASDPSAAGPSASSSSGGPSATPISRFADGSVSGASVVTAAESADDETATAALATATQPVGPLPGHGAGGLTTVLALLALVLLLSGAVLYSSGHLGGGRRAGPADGGGS